MSIPLIFQFSSSNPKFNRGRTRRGGTPNLFSRHTQIPEGKIFESKQGLWYIHCMKHMIVFENKESHVPGASEKKNNECDMI
jgi:hypothetical protein